MTDSRDAQQALTLAVIMQSVHCLRDVAHRGQADPERYQPLIEGLLGEYTGSTDALYGSARLAYGLRRIVEQLEEPSDAETTRYVAAIFHLERRLMKRPALLATVSEGLQQARAQATHFDNNPIHPNVIRNLGDLYSRTVSEMGPRLMVQGEHQHLENPDHAALIRTLLLCAIRGASLWRDNGGGRLALVLRRARIAQASRELLKTLPDDG